MSVKIRLARCGAKKRPSYRMVIADSRAPRDGDFIEKVGTYHPLLDKNDENRVILKTDRIQHWLSNGAQPTDRVSSFIASKGIPLPSAIAKKMELKKNSRVKKLPKKDKKSD